MHELPRIPLLGTSVNKGLLVRLLAFRWRLGTQPQRDVCGLHSLPHHPYQVFAQRIQVRLFPELSRESFQGLSSVVLAAVEAPVYKALYAASQRREQCCYQEGGCHHCEGGLLPSERDEDPLQYNDAAEVEGDQRDGKRTVDEGTVDDAVYVVEAVTEDSDAGGNRDGLKDKYARQGDDCLGQFASGLPEYKVPDERQGGGGGEPLDLLSLVSPRPAEAD